MEPGDVKIAFRQLLSAIVAYLRSREGMWYKAGSISFGVHLILMPIVFFFILRFEKPRETQPVFMLSGGLHFNSVESEDSDLYADELDLLDDEAEDEDWDDDEDMEIEKEVLERLAKEREDIFSLPLHDSPSIAYIDIDEDDEDEDWEDWEEDEEDEDTEVEILDELADEFEDEEEEDEPESKTDVKIAGKKDEPESASSGKKTHWEDIFAKKVKKGKTEKRSEADKKIEGLMAINPYSDDSEPLETGKNFVGGSFFGEGEAQLPDLLLWLPPDIKMAGLISLSLLRSRPDREVFERTFQKLPYFDSIAAGSDLDFFQQIDAVLIATYNPFDVKETYLMLRHNQDEKMIRKAVSRHFKALGVKANWYKISGRDVVQPPKKYFEKIPWIYFFPKDKIVGIVHISKRESIKTLMDTPSSMENPSMHLVGPLERLMRFGCGMPEGAQEEGRVMQPGVVVGSVQFDELLAELNKKKAELNKKKKFPLPMETMVVGRFGQQHISVEGTARFPDTQGPVNFIDRWKNTLDPIRKHKIIKVLGIDKILDFPVWKKGDNGSLTLQALVPSDRVEPLLALIRLLTGGEKETVKKHVPPKKK